MASRAENDDDWKDMADLLFDNGVISDLEHGGTSFVKDTRAFSYQVGAFSEVGTRCKNEDSYHIEPSLIIVSDGIGGAPYGDIMSKVCCQAFRDEVIRLLRAANAPSGESLEDILISAFAKTDEFASRVGRYLGGSPGATLVAALAHEGEIVVASIGDSMAYALEDRALRRIFPGNGRASDDGSTALDAALGYGILFRSREGIQVTRIDPNQCNLIVACTDGVWSQVDEKTMNGEALLQPSSQALAEALVRRAVNNAPDTSDNATAAVMRIICDADSTADGLDESIELDSLD